MIVSDADGNQLRGDFLLSAVQRLDLTPIPSTLELVVRADSKYTATLKAGDTLRAGVGQRKYRIVKIARAASANPQHDGQPVEAVGITAVPEQFYEMAWPLPRGISKVGRSLGEIYRSCGARCPVEEDISIARFACFAGDFPTTHIARVLQEEGALPVWLTSGAISFRRYENLFSGEVRARVTDDAAAAIESPFIERHEIPTAYSVDRSGAVNNGDTESPRGKVFIPWASSHVLRNMSRCIVARRRMMSGYAGHLSAGDVIEVGGVKHVIITAAHRVENGASGVASQTTSLWLGLMSR